MIAVIQRVSSASVSIGGEMTSSVGKGLLILLGIEENDDEHDISWLTSKILNMRIFADEVSEESKTATERVKKLGIIKRNVHSSMMTVVEYQ